MQRSLRHFTEQLVGACSSMKKNEERKQYDMPIHTRIQDRPMVIPYSPQIKQTKHGFINKMSHKVAKNMTTKTLKYHNGKLKFKGDGTHL